MTEVEAKALEESTESIPELTDKENVAPDATENEAKSDTNHSEQDEEQKDVAVTIDSTSKPVTKPDTDPSAIDMSVYTEDKLYDDMKALLDSGDLNRETVSKKKFREALSTKYSLSGDGKGRIFKKHTPFIDALSRIISELMAGQEDDGESAKKEKSKKSKKDQNNKKDKKRKSRKRKRPTADAEEEAAENEDHPDPPTKKRKIDDGAAAAEEASVDGNDGESDQKKMDKKKGDKVDGDGDGEEDGGDDQEEDGDDDDDEDGDTKKTAKSKPRKKGQKAPYERSLTKLKKLARAVGLANPRMYSKMKEMESNKKRVDFLKELLSENNVAFDNLSDRAIEKMREEFALKREMAELGIGTATEKELECEDGVPLSTRRPRRKRKEVNYRTPALPKYRDDDEEEEEGGKGGGGGKNEEEFVEEEEEEEDDESDAYQPSDVDEDDDY